MIPRAIGGERKPDLHVTVCRKSNQVGKMLLEFCARVHYCILISQPSTSSTGAKVLDVGRSCAAWHWCCDSEQQSFMCQFLKQLSEFIWPTVVNVHIEDWPATRIVYSCTGYEERLNSLH